MTEGQLRRLADLEVRAKYKDLGPIPIIVSREPISPRAEGKSSFKKCEGPPKRIIFRVNNDLKDFS